MTKKEKQAATLTGIESKPVDAALTIDEIAALLDVSRWTIVPLLESGALPGFVLKSGRKKRIWRLRKGALMRWIEQREQETRKTLQSSRTGRPALAVVDGEGQQ